MIPPNLTWTTSTDLMWSAYTREALSYKVGHEPGDLVAEESQLRRREYRAAVSRHERLEAVATMGLPLSSYGMGMAYAGATVAEVEEWLPVAACDTVSWLRRLFAQAQADGQQPHQIIRVLALYGHLGEERRAREQRRVSRTTHYGRGVVLADDEGE